MPKTPKDKRALKKQALFNSLIMMLFAGLVIFLGTISWFTMSREVDGSSVWMRSTDTNYVIVSQSGEDSIFSSLRRLLQQSSDAAEWEMNADNNMNNISGADDGIGPGSFGVISFYVVPKDGTVSLDLTFEITGYRYSSVKDGETEQATEKMTLAGDELQKYLNAHILLFEERTAVIDPETQQVTSYTYAKPILSEDGLKTIKSRSFSKSGSNTPVNIYWVWGKTLSVLVDASSVNGVTSTPLCLKNGSDYNRIIFDITNHPTSYFYDFGKTETVDESRMITEYDKYSDKYDRADNCIGLSVSYITLKMSTKESSSGGT